MIVKHKLNKATTYEYDSSQLLVDGSSVAFRGQLRELQKGKDFDASFIIRGI